MLKKLTLLLVLIANVATAQVPDTVLYGFLGIKFQTNKTEVKKAMLAKGAKLALEKRNSLYFKNVTHPFSPYPSDGCFFEFTDQQEIAWISLEIKIEDENEVVPLYDEIVEKLSKKYYGGFDNTETNNGFTVEDKTNVSAIKNGFVLPKTIWGLTDPIPNHGEQVNSINIGIDTDLTIHILYTNHYYFEKLQKQKEIRESKQY
jgi:hypothetical protein